MPAKSAVERILRGERGLPRLPRLGGVSRPAQQQRSVGTARSYAPANFEEALEQKRELARIPFELKDEFGGLEREREAAEDQAAEEKTAAAYRSLGYGPLAQPAASAGIGLSALTAEKRFDEAEAQAVYERSIKAEKRAEKEALRRSEAEWFANEEGRKAGDAAREREGMRQYISRLLREQQGLDVTVADRKAEDAIRAGRGDELASFLESGPGRAAKQAAAARRRAGIGKIAEDYGQSPELQQAWGDIGQLPPRPKLPKLPPITPLRKGQIAEVGRREKGRTLLNPGVPQDAINEFANLSPEERETELQLQSPRNAEYLRSLFEELEE